MGGRRNSSSSSNSKKSSNGHTSTGGSSPGSSIVDQLEMLRNFCPDFAEQDLSACLSQAGYNVQLAAERLMTGQYKPAHANKQQQQQQTPKQPKKVVSISSVKAAPPPTSSHKTTSNNNNNTGTVATPSSSSVSATKKRPSSESSSSSLALAPNTSSSSRPAKKRSPHPHVIPATPRYTVSTPTTVTTTAATGITDDDPGLLLLCERWLVGHCTQRQSRVAHREVLELQHYHTGNNTSVRFRGSHVEGNLCKSLSAMVTPLLRQDLVELRAAALMDDRNIPMGGEVALTVTVYLKEPRAFFALFENDKAQDTTKSSMYFANRNCINTKRTSLSSKMTIAEAAFAFLQWAEYGNLPEIPDFAVAAAVKPTGEDKQGSSDSDNDDNDNDDDDSILLQEEDFAAEEEESDETPEWAKSVNNAESDSSKQQRLPELDDPVGLDDSVVLRPYQRQALYWMMKREQEGESREELEQELALLSELAAHQNPSCHSDAPGGGSTAQQDIVCDCGPVLVSEAGRKAAKTLDGQANPVNHPLWKPRYLAQRGMGGAVLFYVNELLGIATCHPPAPPQQCSGGILADDM